MYKMKVAKQGRELPVLEDSTPHQIFSCLSGNISRIRKQETPGIEMNPVNIRTWKRG
jgi:hypothetical protein